MRSLADILELAFDPLLDIAPPVAEVPPHPKAGRSLSPMLPLVEGGHRHSEIGG